MMVGTMRFEAPDPATGWTVQLSKGGVLFQKKFAPDDEMRGVADEFGTVEAESKPFARDGEDLTIDGGDYTRLPPFAPGALFEGIWRYFFASSGAGASSSGGVSAERFLVMARDGTFRRSGWAGGSGSTNTGEGTSGFTTGSAQPPASGHYRVEGYALELTGDDGKTERLSIFALDRYTDKLLVIDGANYLKQD